MSSLADVLFGASAVNESRSCPRWMVDGDRWRLIASLLRAGLWTLASLWGDAGVAHMALIDETRKEMGIVSLACDDGAFPSVGALHPPAIRLQRAIHDLFGHRPIGAPDARPW